MNTASTASPGARETAKDARQATAGSSTDIHDDLQKLRDEFHRLADQVAEIFAGRGNAAWRRAKSTVDEAFAEAQDKGRDAASAVREVSDNFVDALDESLKTRPYTTLALVAGIAFLFGATWRR
jgi:ElaB/YqjD/DUF883 family membrane-anchored ribosome-binding protein